MIARRDDDFIVGALSSIVGHLIVCLLIFLHLRQPMNPFPSPTIYSISIEGGKNIGGISQLQTQDKTPLAPAKNVSGEKPPEPTTQPDSDPKPKDKPTEPEDDAEVSLATKPTPTPKPSATAQPKATAAPKATPKATTAKTPEKQPTPVKTAKQNTADINKNYEKAMQRYLGESSEAGGKGFGAAKIGGNSMGGGVVRPPEFFTYRDLLQRHVKHEWRWYDNRASLVTQVAFELDADGAMRNIRVVRGSGSAEFDDSVMRALVKANPAPAPPQNVHQFFRSVTMTFDPRE